MLSEINVADKMGNCRSILLTDPRCGTDQTHRLPSQDAVSSNAPELLYDMQDTSSLCAADNFETVVKIEPSPLSLLVDDGGKDF